MRCIPFVIYGLGLLAVIVCFSASIAQATPFQDERIGPANLAVIVNDSDPLSVKVGKYYKLRRKIPQVNIIHVHFRPGTSSLSRAEFRKIKRQVDKATPGNVQAYALAWTQPYRVDCMSITTAFAAGFDEGFCSKMCQPTKPSPYFDSSSRAPYTDYHWRPAMALAGKSYKDVKSLIDRGIAADHTFPRGVGYLVSTADRARNIRAVQYPAIAQKYIGSWFDLRVVKADFIEDKDNVMFYFTGVAKVTALNTIRFLPGAIADHLTSSGGELIGSEQMSSLSWLEAGATGSYGAVVEPCNFLAKFPDPGIVINHYLHGETLIEAYWKSVAWPGQGIFIGEPLAAPYSTQDNTVHRQ
ncbi:MAG: TIGR03790 family protein [Sulfuricaulis sp.]